MAAICLGLNELTDSGLNKMADIQHTIYNTLQIFTRS